MKISELAKAAAVNIETIRYYERRQLLTQPVKPALGYRDYSEKTLERLLFIKGAQKLGFTLEEIASLLLLGEQQCLSVQAIAEHKLVDIKEKIANLARLEHLLEDLVIRCKCNPSETACPIVTALVPK
ncbi:MAG: MerR family mercuric resistance operon transcriptional regulator [Oceanospirillaceae bacterium]|jgi:MerR family mercuric resistance operon transcriptional regulator